MNNSVPIVFAGGIYSNLEFWENNGKGLARQMANEGYNVWEIELTGGPNNDCPNCPNYNYSDLVDYYWPASIAGIMQYSGKNKVNYVGHSNGCRVALSSLNNYSTNGKSNAGYYFDYTTGTYVTENLPQQPVDVFIGVGCPGILNNNSLTESVVTATWPQISTLLSGESQGDYSLRLLRGKLHLTQFDYGKNMVGWLPAIITLDTTTPISYNLQSFYNDLYMNRSTTLNLSRVNVSAFYIVGGNIPLRADDGAVPISDIYLINASIPHNKGSVFILTLWGIAHAELPSNTRTRAIIEGAVND